jgi:hypothetical protein
MAKMLFEVATQNGNHVGYLIADGWKADVMNGRTVLENGEPCDIIKCRRYRASTDSKIKSVPIEYDDDRKSFVVKMEARQEWRLEVVKGLRTRFDEYGNAVAVSRSDTANRVNFIERQTYRRIKADDDSAVLTGIAAKIEQRREEERQKRMSVPQDAFLNATDEEVRQWLRLMNG